MSIVHHQSPVVPAVSRFSTGGIEAVGEGEDGPEGGRGSLCIWGTGNWKDCLHHSPTQRHEGLYRLLGGLCKHVGADTIALIFRCCAC